MIFQTTPISFNEIGNTRVLIRGAGDLASGVAHRLYRCGFRVCMIEATRPLAVRRMVSFCEAVYEGQKTIEGVTAICVRGSEGIISAWTDGNIPILVDPDNETQLFLKPHVLVDCIMAKRNMGTKKNNAPLVIGMGPGFHAGVDVNVVIETNRGHDLGKLIFNGQAERNTGVPGSIGGFSTERVLRAPCSGILKVQKNIGQRVVRGEQLAHVGDMAICSEIDGIIRGMLRDMTPVSAGQKVGDVDPRQEVRLCPTISDKARSLGGAVIEAILLELPKLSAP